jgi:hypothetical protein
LVVPSRFVAECVRLLEGLLPSLWSNLFGRLDNVLSQLADRSSSELSDRAYCDAQMVLSAQRDHLELVFLQQVQLGAEAMLLHGHGPEPRPYPKIGFGDLALVEEAELEEILVVENLVSKAESRHRRELMELDRRIARLMGWGEVGIADNPFGPSALCSAFRCALETVPDLDPAVKLAIYKLFDKQVMDQLGAFYHDCLMVAKAYRGSSDWLATDSVGTPDRAETLTPDSVHHHAGSVSIPFDELQGLLARQRSARAPQASVGVTIETTELVALLSNLDVSPVLGAGQPGIEGLLRERLSTALSSSPGDQPRRALAERDEDTLDLVFLFFEHLLAGTDIPDPIKTLIARMQIPVAKLALLDKEFFSDQEHPARRLLNDIGEAAVGWSEDDGRGPDSLYGMTERVIERLVLDFDGDPKLFTRLGRYFRAFIAREQARAALANDASAWADPATPLVDDRQVIVSQLIAERLARYAQVPAVVERILTEGWTQVLLETHRTHGPGTGAWRKALDLVDRLLWSVSPKRDPEDRRQLLKRIPGLLETLRLHLSEVGYDQRQMARWFKDLQTLHLDVLQGAEVGARLVAPETDPGPPDSGDPSLPLCEVGDWIELTRESGERARMRLALWRPDRDELVFVDRAGRNRAKFSGRDFDRLLKQGRISVLDGANTPVADRALDALLKDLEQGQT